MTPSTWKTSRRGLLRTALGLGAVLSTAGLASANTNPFTPLSQWGGPFVSAVTEDAGSITINVTNVPGIVIVLIQKAGAASSTNLVANLTYFPNGTVMIQSGSAFSLQGTVTPTGFSSYTLNASYFNNNVAGLADGYGSLSAVSFQARGLVSIAEVDANIPSISIFPPDFLGFFESRSGLRGSVVFHRNPAPAPSYDGRPMSKITGALRFNDLAFNFTMTFAPLPNADGSFSFVLVGGSPRGMAAVPLVVAEGRFFPGSPTGGPGSVQGTYQMTGFRGVPLDLGRLSLLAVP